MSPWTQTVVASSQDANSSQDRDSSCERTNMQLQMSVLLTLRTVLGLAQLHI